MKVLLGVTGSVAATLGTKLVKAFAEDEVRVVPTRTAIWFAQTAQSPKGLMMSHGFPGATVLSESEEWKWDKVGDPILHIELRDWMNVMVIAPLSANTLGKMANGICDNLLLSIWLAAGGKPIVVAPAMNTQMWEHPAVKKNVGAIRDMGVWVVDPIEKTLACGETGVGAMAPMNLVVETTKRVVEIARRNACAR